MKTRSSARLNCFGALCHPKHVLGVSQSLPSRCPSLAVLGLVTLLWELSAVLCVALMGSGFSYKIKSQDSYFLFSTGITGLTDPLPLRSKRRLELVFALLCEASSLLNEHTREGTALALVNTTQCLHCRACSRGQRPGGNTAHSVEESVQWNCPRSSPSLSSAPPGCDGLGTPKPDSLRYCKCCGIPSFM